MSTLNEMVEEVLLGIEGYSGDQAVIGTLSADIAPTTSTMTLLGGPFADGLNFSTGLVEVGEELCYAQMFNRTTGVYSGVLRGWRGTVAVAHVAGEEVRTNPTYPQVAVRRAINDTIRNMSPMFGVQTLDLIANGDDRYDIPSDVGRVLSVAVEPWGSDDAWYELNQWSVAPRPYGMNAQALDLPSIVSGRRIRVTYASDPATLSLLTDDFSTTGLPDYAQEVVVYGAMWRLVSMPDLSRVSGLSTSQAIQADASPPGYGRDQAKYLAGMYQQLK